jgi:hypothetical protein
MIGADVFTRHFRSTGLMLAALNNANAQDLASSTVWHVDIAP